MTGLSDIEMYDNMRPGLTGTLTHANAHEHVPGTMAALNAISFKQKKIAQSNGTKKENGQKSVDFQLFF